MFNQLLKKQKESLEKKLNELNQNIQLREKDLAYINSLLEQSNKNLKQIKSETIESNEKLMELKKEIGETEGIISMEDLGIEYVPVSNNFDEITNKINTIQKQIAKLLNENILNTTRIYRIDGSEFKGRQFQKTFCENLLIGFNSYFDKKKKSISQNNFYQTQELIKKKFKTMNDKSSIVGIFINEKYLTLCLQLLQTTLDQKITKEEEKERIREERRRLREQEKLLAEAEKTKLELQKQRRMYEQSLAKALSEQERQEFENKLKEIDKREADVDYRINNNKAGYLYIAATKAMPDCCKLGVTRRLNPLVRLSELSSASVPFPFVCYGLVFSDNAFDLETRIHEYFDNKRVNTENKHKEFFYITPQEAIKVLKEEFGCDVHFVNEDESEDEDEIN